MDAFRDDPVPAHLLFYQWGRGIFDVQYFYEAGEQEADGVKG